MGQVDGDSAETLDKDMWAGDSDNEEDQPGDGQEQGENSQHLLVSVESD